MKYTIISVLAIFLLAACNDSQTGPCNDISLNQQFTAKIHDNWCLAGGDLSITFDEIVSDGRCNVDEIVCVWAGSFDMGVTIETGGETYLDTFFGPGTWRDTLTAGIYAIEMIKVLPETRSQTNMPDTSDYRFEMVIR